MAVKANLPDPMVWLCSNWYWSLGYTDRSVSFMSSSCRPHAVVIWFVPNTGMRLVILGVIVAMHGRQDHTTLNHGDRCSAGMRLAGTILLSASLILNANMVFRKLTTDNNVSTVNPSVSMKSVMLVSLALAIVSIDAHLLPSHQDETFDHLRPLK